MWKQRFSGVELEFVGYKNYEFWTEVVSRAALEANLEMYEDLDEQHGVRPEADLHLTYDASVSGRGLELITRPFLITDTQFRDSLAHVLNTIRLNGGIIDTTCGLHVHVAAEDFSLTHLYRLLLFVLEWEEVLAHLQHPYRRNTGFCMYLRPQLLQYNLICSLGKQTDPTNIVQVKDGKADKLYETVICRDRHILRNVISRYSIVNIIPYWNARHYEVRLGQGTLNPVRLWNWVMLQLKIAYYVHRAVPGPVPVRWKTRIPNLANVQKLFEVLDFKEGLPFFEHEYLRYLNR